MSIESAFVPSGYVPVIGLEIHVELKTKTKLFCACPTRFGEKANRQTCPVCLGMPGAYPHLNKEALRLSLQCASVLHCEISDIVAFDRKNYLYPDLPKGYQISQFHHPIGRNGHFPYYVNGTLRDCPIEQIHMEDDAGKIQYAADGSSIEMDYNRSGIPLVEIVTTPCFSNAEEVIAFTELLQRSLVFCGITDGKMQEGSLRVDLNLSVRHPEEETLRTRCEIKNLSSFSSIRQAVEEETKRQISLYEQGIGVVRQTLRFDEDHGRILVMRDKEDSKDYRYFPDPDLPVLKTEEVFAPSDYQTYPELPFSLIRKYLKTGLSFYDANLVAESPAYAAYFDQCLARNADPKLAANYLLSFIRPWEKDSGTYVYDSFLSPVKFTLVLQYLREGKINSTSARDILSACFAKDLDPVEYMDTKGLLQGIPDKDLLGLCREVLASHPREVQSYRNGKEKLLEFFIGQVMKQTRGTVSADRVRSVFLECLKN